MDTKRRREMISWIQPLVAVFEDKGIVVQMGIGGVDAIDLLLLSGAEGFLLIQAPDSFQ